ncbi:uncharacterized protein LOC111024316 [Momordica charantia]|uniref:Uncharacterized protein LOC111024316 n=1 Tax=Momordica charantia TaxID=3673 RepID=A0A6J1DX39_MOMCH|nr:uncharacterized protein LOC111024316 [Momordica charantia]
MLQSQLPAIKSDSPALNSFYLAEEMSTLRMIGKGKFCDGLYLLESSVASYSAAISFPTIVTHVTVRDPTTLWHARLDHLSHHHLLALKSFLHTAVFQSPHNDSCKKRRLPFTSHSHLSVAAFDLVHAYIWASFATVSHTGYSYFLSIVDDYTCYTWVYLLRKKSNVLQIVPQFFHLVQT